MPIDGSYLMPRSMCSSTPKPKLPVELKFLYCSSYSFTRRPLSRISAAFSPRTVTWHEIFSLRRMPNVRTVYRALEKTGVWPVSCSSTLDARVSRSPLSPTQQLTTSFSIWTPRMGFSALLLLAAIPLAINPNLLKTFQQELGRPADSRVPIFSRNFRRPRTRFVFSFPRRRGFVPHSAPQHRMWARSSVWLTVAADGAVRCRMCGVPVISERDWNRHQGTDGHLRSVSDLRGEQARRKAHPQRPQQPPPPPQIGRA